MKAVVPSAKAEAETTLLLKLDSLADSLSQKAEKLDKVHKEAAGEKDAMAVAKSYADKVIPVMAETRAVADELEALIAEEYKPFPSYEDLLFRV